MQTPDLSPLLGPSCSKDRLLGAVAQGAAYISARRMLFLLGEQAAAPALFSITANPPALSRDVQGGGDSHPPATPQSFQPPG